MTEPIRVLVADDHPVYRDGLMLLLRQIDGIDVVGTATNGLEALERAESLDPDVLIMDLRMPELDGIEATRRIAETHPNIAVVVLSMFADDDLVFAAVRAGARAYLLKDADDEQIASVVRGVARGEVIFGTGTAERLLAHLAGDGGTSARPPEAGFPQLTQRERDVLELLARGHTNTEIAGRLFLSERTVRNYVSNVFTKLQVANRAQAIVTARDAGVGRQPPTVAAAGDDAST